jgi:NADH dehydrogenase
VVPVYDPVTSAAVSAAGVMAAVLFGPGTNPKNFVAAADVAALIVRALGDPEWRGETVETGGPENLSSRQVVAVFERMTGKPAKVVHLPLPVLRAVSRVAHPIHPRVSRILQAAIVGETTDQRFDPAPLLARIPLKLTRLEDWARANTGH